MFRVKKTQTHLLLHSDDTGPFLNEKTAAILAQIVSKVGLLVVDKRAKL